MSYIRYKNNNLFVEGVSVRKLTSKFSTPFYLYSESNIIENYRSFSSNFKKSNPLICFSVKANSNIQILKVLKKMGSGADVVSGGELLKAIKSGIKPNKIVFSGVGKTEDEIKFFFERPNLSSAFPVEIFLCVGALISGFSLTPMAVFLFN